MLHKNTVAAMYEPVEKEKLEEVSTATPSTKDSPSHIDELLHRSSSSLTESQKQSLRSLLYQYKD